MRADAAIAGRRDEGSWRGPAAAVALHAVAAALLLAWPDGGGSASFEPAMTVELLFSPHRPEAAPEPQPAPQ
ncbi:MAG: hypothetical protein HY985_14730, partial [Magnetospirillum sp.]|nr:hypothetical protein [Magnetospirillum sp.]